MGNRLKQRVVGVLVLIALAVVFVPALFNFQPSPPLDETSQIPPAPSIEPVEIEEPVKPVTAEDTVDYEDAFELPAPEENHSVESGVNVESEDGQEGTEDEGMEIAGDIIEEEKESSKPDKAPPQEPPALTESGLPAAWVIQVISYSEAGSADKLVKRLNNAGFKAFSQSALADGRTVYRVYEGPYVLKDRAQQQKSRIDSSLGVKSLILPFEP